MSFGQPWVLLLLPALAFAAVARWAWILHLRRRLAAIGAGHREHAASHHRGRARLATLLQWLALAAGLVAAAQPRSGSDEGVRRASGANLAILLDCSRSMQAADLYPSRIEVARRKAIGLLEAAPEHRAALLPFAAISFLRCPLTGDRLALDSLLDECAPDLFPAERDLQGTAIGNTVRRAVEMLGENADRGQAILVFSDGRDYDEAAVAEAARTARHAGIPVHGIFVADPERTVSVEIDGKPVTMESSRTTLELLARETGGICVNATTSSEDILAIREHLDRHLARLPYEERRRIVAAERYQVPLLAAVLLAAAGLLMPLRRRRSP